MTTAAKHKRRSHRNHRIYYMSKDRAFHGNDFNLIYKNSKNKKKYHGDGSLIIYDEKN